MTIEMKTYQEFGPNRAEEVDSAQSLRRDINWATKKTLAVDEISSGSLISTLKKSAVILAGKTTEGREDVVIVLPQISTNDPERVEEVRVAAVAIQKEATHKAAQQKLISLETAEEKLQNIDDGIEPRPKIIFQKTQGLMREESKNARIARKIVRERQQASKVGGSSEARTSNIWQIPSKKTEKKVNRKKVIIIAGTAFLVAGCNRVAMTQMPTESVPPTENSPTPTETPKATATTEVTPEILAKPTESLVAVFSSPTDPPEYMEDGAGNPSVESIKKQAEIDRYRALLVLARQEGEIISGMTDSAVKEQLDFFAKQTKVEVEQEWNGKSGNDYQMVSVNIRMNNDGTQTVFWFATKGGALSARPDIPPTLDSELKGINVPLGKHAEFRWGDDRNIYMFLVDDINHQAEAWFNSTAPAEEGAVMAGKWEIFTKVTPEMIERLAGELECAQFFHQACIEEYIYSPGDFDFQMISTGIFETIPLYDTGGENDVGELTVLNVVSKDKNLNPFTAQVIAQVEFYSDPGVNTFPGFMAAVKIVNGTDFATAKKYGKKILSLEEWKELMPEGSFWELTIYKNGTPSDFKFLDGTELKTSEYAQQTREFLESGGSVSVGIPLLPTGMSTH